MVPVVAAAVKLGSELMGASPYSVKRARPVRSTITFDCHLVISVTAQRREGLRSANVEEG